MRYCCFQADNCYDKEVIYAFLDANGIGKTHSDFYISYALHLEVKNKFKAANQTFELGISRYCGFLSLRPCNEIDIFACLILIGENVQCFSFLHQLKIKLHDIPLFNAFHFEKKIYLGIFYGPNT
jgi:hypothetical protein